MSSLGEETSRTASLGPTMLPPRTPWGALCCASAGATPWRACSDCEPQVMRNLYCACEQLDLCASDSGIVACVRDAEATRGGYADCARARHLQARCACGCSCVAAAGLGCSDAHARARLQVAGGAPQVAGVRAVAKQGAGGEAVQRPRPRRLACDRERKAPARRRHSGPYGAAQGEDVRRPWPVGLHPDPCTPRPDMQWDLSLRPALLRYSSNSSAHATA
jgi:hypothetical protein